ncbi:alpha/beta-hydrolase [Lichtheimia hyalospora FSU 10163]|nr:alpha/beta-hydrolase [Lichtheimia hyalospora FSU 10163]
MIASGLRFPFYIQRPMLKMMQAPQSEHYSSILRVRFKTWVGDWIVPDIQKQHDPKAWMKTTIDKADLVVMFIHGGGFHLGTSTQYMPAFLNIISQLKNNHQLNDVRILSVDYSLSPMVAHPTALNECVSAYRYLVHDLSISPSRIIVAGDSAGGNLTAATLLKIRDQRHHQDLAELPPIPLSAGAAMISPWVDLNDDQSINPANDVETDFVRSWQIRSYFSGYLPQLAQMNLQERQSVLQQPDVSPFYADYHDFCPVLLTIGGGEFLRPQIEAFAKKLEKDGVDLDITTRSDAPHCYIVESNNNG